MKYLFVVMGILSVCFSYGGGKTLYPVYLRVEYKENPFIDVSHPRLSWELEAGSAGQYQTAYQVLVASSAHLLDQDWGDLWDSGKVATNATNQIEYQGNPIPSRTKVFWKVRSWD